MTTPATDGKMIVNALYHSTVVSGLAMRYARLRKMGMGGSTPKLHFAPRDVGTHRRHGPRSGPSAWTINEEFVGEAMP